MAEDVIAMRGLTDVGVSIMIIVVLLYAIIKLIPNWINLWKSNVEAENKRKGEEQSAMQAYYDERNKTYQQQMDTMNELAKTQNNLVGQATQVIARSNEVIAGNTKALEQNTTMHDKVITALATDLQATRDISLMMKDHDDRAQVIYNNIIRLLDRAH